MPDAAAALTQEAASAQGLHAQGALRRVPYEGATEGELEPREPLAPCLVGDGWRAAFRPRMPDSQVPSLVADETGVTRLTELVAQQGQQRFPVRVTGAAVG